MNVLNSRVAAADRGEEAKRDRKPSHLDSNADVDCLSPIGPGVRGKEKSVLVHWESVRPRQLLHSTRNRHVYVLRFLHVSQHSTAFYVMMQPHLFLPCSRELNLGLYQRGRMGGPATIPRFCT